MARSTSVAHILVAVAASTVSRGLTMHNSGFLADADSDFSVATGQSSQSYRTLTGEFNRKLSASTVSRGLTMHNSGFLADADSDFSVASQRSHPCRTRTSEFNNGGGGAVGNSQYARLSDYDVRQEERSTATEPEVVEDAYRLEDPLQFMSRFQKMQNGYTNDDNERRESSGIIVPVAGTPARSTGKKIFGVAVASLSTFLVGLMFAGPVVAGLAIVLAGLKEGYLK